MANIRIELTNEIIDGQPVTFVAPCDCVAITGLKVYYPGGSKAFTFKDAHGNNLTGLGNLFAAGAYVKAILDVKNGFAYLQNADTNAYIESTFVKKVDAADVPKTKNGKAISINDAGNAPLQGLKLYGKTTQFTTTGAQLIPFPYEGNITGEANGITWTVGEDRTIKASGTKDEMTSSGFCIVTIHNPAPGKYHLSGAPKGGSWDTFCLLANWNGPDGGDLVYDTGDGVTFEITNQTLLKIYARICESSSGTINQTFKPMLNVGTTAKSYEPYTGGKPAPNPDYPQELESVGESRNLWNPANVLSGYANADTAQFVSHSPSRTCYIPCEPNTTYTVSKKAGQKFSVCYTTELPQVGVAIYGITPSSIMKNASVSYTTGADAKYLLAWVFNSNGDTGTAEEMLATVQIEKGDKATPYKPYQKGNIGVTVLGKNLLETVNGTYTLAGVYELTLDNGHFEMIATGTGELSSNAMLPYTTTFLPAGTYTFSLQDYTGLNGSIYIRNVTNSNKVIHSGTTAAEANRTKTFTLDTDAEVAFGIYYYVTGTTSTTTASGNVMINQGTTAEPFEPHIPNQTLTAQTPNGLPGIPVSSGGNYTDESGQQWICDEVDFANGVYVQRIARSNMSTKTWTAWSAYANAFYAAYYDKKPGVKNLVSNMYPVSDGVYKNTLSGNSSNGTIYIRDPAYATADELKAALSESVLLYELATPIETPLSPEELAQYAALHTNKPNTTVFNDAGADMEITYCTPNTAVPMNMGSGNAGKVLSVDEHGCVMPKSITGYAGSAENEDEFLAIINQCLSQMANDTVRHVSISLWGRHSVTIHKHVDNYASIEDVTYAPTINGEAAYYKRTRALFNGNWLEWEYFNPPMDIGVEYRTTERWEGYPVYKKLIAVDSMPNNEAKEILLTGMSPNSHKFVDVKWSFKYGSSYMRAGYLPDSLSIAFHDYNKTGAWVLELVATADYSIFNNDAYIMLAYIKF